MTCLDRRYSLLLLAILLIVSAGCITAWPSSNTTPLAAAPAASPQAGVATATVSPVPTFSDHGSLNVLRGEPFTVTGTVPNRAITMVQVWLLNGSISTILEPVMPDGTFRITLDSGVTSALSRNFTSAIVAQYPSPPDQFAVNLDPASGHVVGSSVIPARILTEVNDKQVLSHDTGGFSRPGHRIPRHEQLVYHHLPQRDRCHSRYYADSARVPGHHDCFREYQPPAGTPLSIGVGTVSFHPTSKNYDFSHESAEGSAVVTAGPVGINHYYGTVDTSRLNTGKYFVAVNSGNQSLQAGATIYADVIAPLPAQPGPGNYINWSALALPTLATNETMAPVLLAGEWTIVPPGTSTQDNEVPYGSIIDCAPDGICRVYDQAGVQFLAVYNSNEEHMMGVPNGAMIDSAAGGNVTIISLDGKVILTKIDEYPRGN